MPFNVHNKETNKDIQSTAIETYTNQEMEASQKLELENVAIFT